MLIFVSSFSCKYRSSLGDSAPLKTTAPSSADHLTLAVPCEGNSWVYHNAAATDQVVVAGGVKNWTSTKDVIRTYFFAHQTGQIELGLKANFGVPTTLSVSFGNRTQEIQFSKSEDFPNYYIGKFKIDQVGYQFIELRAVSAASDHFGEISHVLLGDTFKRNSVAFMDKDWFYWGRRGPSVHLRYRPPSDKEVQWFYNEVRVPKGKDPVGSFFMANGFSEGYFGIQVNSRTERRILFSVWSAYSTDDPNQIPSDYQVINLGNGADVTVQNFGNEGSGKQSFKVFNWQAGTTYKFLVKGEPSVNNSTDYTAYFYAPEVGKWQLIASLRRPHTYKHLTGIHSFLENFATTTGDESRKGNYSNQWVYTTDGKWQELTSATFSYDATANSKVRFDYAGGAEGSSFYLQNCGFFSGNVDKNTRFEREVSGLVPNINFSLLQTP